VESADVSSFFSAVVATLLAKNPEARFGSAAQLQAVLEEGERSSWWGEREAALLLLERRLPRIPVRRETELLGRDAELEQLADAWRDAQQGRGATILLEGEAGIGKTRLVDSFVRSLVDEDLHVPTSSVPPTWRTRSRVISGPLPT
jgi:hypothetical protein